MPYEDNPVRVAYVQSGLRAIVQGECVRVHCMLVHLTLVVKAHADARRRWSRDNHRDRCSGDAHGRDAYCRSFAREVCPHRRQGGEPSETNRTRRRWRGWWEAGAG